MKTFRFFVHFKDSVISYKIRIAVESPSRIQAKKAIWQQYKKDSITITNQ